MKHNQMVKIFSLTLAMLVIGLAGCSPSAAAEPTDTPTTAPSTTATETPPTETPQSPSPTSTDLPPSPTPDLASQKVSIEGRWEGSLSVGGTSIATTVYFRTEDNTLQVSLDIPAQNLFGYQLKEVAFDGVNIHFEGFEEANRKATWDGVLQEDGTIQGEFNQLGYMGTFELTPAEMVVSDEPPPPYPVEDVEFYNGDITLGGTLTTPEGEGPFPAFVLISGSGAQNRDEEIFGFKIFGMIADHFTRNGIAVLRYDDRGVGASSGNLIESTSADLAGDVLAAIEYLKTRAEIDPAQIGLLGHSEGGIIAPMVANQTEDVGMLILLAGSSIPGEEIIYLQIELLARADGATEEEIKEGLEKQHKLFDALLSGEGWDDAKADLRQEIADQVEALSTQQKTAIGDLEKYIDTVWEQQVTSLESAWYLYFLSYDPGPALEQLTVPVLGIFGELDLQVPPDANAQVMEDALIKAGNPDFLITIYPKANHIFQEANTGSVNEYAALKKEFIPGLLEDMTNWILERVTTSE